MSGITESSLFDSIPAGALPSIWDAAASDVNAAEVFKMLDFSNKELARATRIPIGTLRKVLKAGNQLPEELRQLAREWARTLELVAGYFDGNAGKTALWFKVPNPLLGGLSPREMIEFGRSRKLHDIIEDALAGDIP